MEVARIFVTHCGDFVGIIKKKNKKKKKKPPIYFKALQFGYILRNLAFAVGAPYGITQEDGSGVGDIS